MNALRPLHILLLLLAFAGQVAASAHNAEHVDGNDHLLELCSVCITASSADCGAVDTSAIIPVNPNGSVTYLSLYTGVVSTPTYKAPARAPPRS